MFKGVEVVCFLAAYVVAFGLEAIKLRWKESKLASTGSFVFLLLGVFAHVLFLYYNDLLQNNRFSPSAGGWLYVLALMVVAALIYLKLVYPKTQFALFLLPVVFALIAGSIIFGNATFTRAATCRCVRAIHSVALMMATLIAFLGAIAGAMYLWQRARLKKKKGFQGFRLPSIEWLGKASVLTANSLVVALGVGVVCGFYLEVFAQRSAEPATKIDFVAFGATILFLGAFLARTVTSKTKINDSNASAAIHNIVCAAVIVVLLSLALFSPTGHLKKLSQFSPPRSRSTISSEYCQYQHSRALKECQGCQFVL